MCPTARGSATGDRRRPRYGRRGLAARACLSDHGAPRSRSGAGEAAPGPERLPLEVELRPGAVPGRTGGGVAVKLRRSAVSRALAGQVVVQQLELGATWGPCGAGVASSYAKSGSWELVFSVRELTCALGRAFSPPCPVRFLTPRAAGHVWKLFAAAPGPAESKLLQCAARRSRCCSPQPLLSP